MFADDTAIPLPALYVEATDPTSIYTDGRSFVKRMWLDTSTGTIGTLKKRNPANDGWNTLINFDAAAATFTTEQVQDIVGAMFPDNSDLDWTYDDGAGTEVATLKGGASALNPAFSVLTDGATITWATGGARVNNAKVTLGGNRTLDITGEVDGASGVLIVIQDGTGSRTLTLPGSSKVIDGGSGAVTLSTAPGSIDILAWVYDGVNFYWTKGLNYT